MIQRTPSEYIRQKRRLILSVVVLVVCFSKPLWDLARYAAASELYSHILLVPFVSVYGIWLCRRQLWPDDHPVRKWALLPWIGGLGLLLGYSIARHSGFKPAREDYLAVSTLAFLLLFCGVCCFWLGGKVLRVIAFPLALLSFMVPFPVVVRSWIETFLQHASALAADCLFTVCGTPFLREGLIFRLPGINLTVAPECSGIHSTLVLFITSLVAGQLFLRSSGKRAVLAFAVIPLGILRNAVRIVTIGELCIHVSPDMINSDLHHRGGPLFFLVSLVPLFLLLYALRRLEVRKQAGAKVIEKQQT